MSRTLIMTTAAMVALSTFLIVSAQPNPGPAATVTAAGPDTLLQRIKSAEYVGLRNNSGDASYTAFLLTSEQIEQKQLALAEYRRKSEEIGPRLEELRRQGMLPPEGFSPADRQGLRQALNERNQALNEEAAKLQQELGSPPPYIGLVYEVVHCGEDYIELIPRDRGRSPLLVPLSRISQVALTLPQRQEVEVATPDAADQ